MYINRGNIVPRSLSLYIDDNIASYKASGTLTSDETDVSAEDTVTINGREYTFVSALTGAENEVLIGANADATLQNLVDLINEGREEAQATGTLTSDETNVSASDEVVIGTNTYVFVEALTEAYATAVLTSDETNPDAGDTVTIGGIVYTFATDIDGWQPYKVLIGADTDETLQNLADAINGVNLSIACGMGTIANPYVTSGDVTTNTITVTAIDLGVGGNAIGKAEDSDHLDWDGAGAYLTGGLDSVANEILIGEDADTTLQNLADAINDGGDGVSSSTATEASDEVVSTDVATHAIVVTAIDAGVEGNSLAKSETSSHLDWDGTGAYLTGGITETSINADVVASDVASHATTLTAITGGVAGNAITLAEATEHITKSGATLSGGGARIGSVDIGGEGGILRKVIVDLPQFAGTPTVGFQIKDTDDNVLYDTGDSDLTENAITEISKELLIKPTDKFVLTASSTVEDNLEVMVHLR